MIGTPIGILAGTYLAEYGRYAGSRMVVRFINDILLSAPSIVIGLFVYEIMVAPMGHFSGWAGAVALAIIVIPVVVRTTEDMLALVPKELREAATALGMPRAHVIGSSSARSSGAATRWCRSSCTGRPDAPNCSSGSPRARSSTTSARWKRTATGSATRRGCCAAVEDDPAASRLGRRVRAATGRFRYAPRVP